MLCTKKLQLSSALYNHEGKLLYQESRGKSGQANIQLNALDSTHFSKIPNYCIKQFMEFGHLHGPQTKLFLPPFGKKYSH
jgi:hypothetical protein